MDKSSEKFYKTVYEYEVIFSIHGLVKSEIVRTDTCEKAAFYAGINACKKYGDDIEYIMTVINKKLED